MISDNEKLLRAVLDRLRDSSLSPEQRAFLIEHTSRYTAFGPEDATEIVSARLWPIVSPVLGLLIGRNVLTDTGPNSRGVRLIHINPHVNEWKDS